MRLESEETYLYNWLKKNMISLEGEYDKALELLIKEHDGEELIEKLEKEGK